MEYKDYYQILGVGKDADEKEIKRAFRRLARQYHPDVNPGDDGAEERFKEINEAYEVLSDPEKRSKYDRLGADWRRWQQSGGRPSDFDWGQWAAGAPGGQRVHVRYGTPDDFEDLFGSGNPFSDFFSQIFGGMGGGAAPGGFQYRVRPQRGQDYEQEVEISLREAYQGTRRALQKDGRKLEVKIPPGARTGTRVRMSGEGGPGAAGGEAGDLYLRVRVAPDPQFERPGDDLHVSVPVDLYTAVLGGKAQVPTLSGPVKLTIPAGTQNGRVFRLRGKGMPHLRQPDQHGDLYAKVEVQVPTRLTSRQRELFEELRQISGKEDRR
ncbi:MAG: J domain-containing protein [Chloroflexi bacterium]|nr:MAG: J domain-containing protein [Chloroflexota bacterium]RLC77927.1 MAG: J domain-containing protein [Chloroflexota bacterium]HEY71663.1 J domain-containing protein [Thermoflexia bacterium]